MIRHKQRHIHGTIVNFVTDCLQRDGWTSDTPPFGATPVTILDYQPEEAGEPIAPNTVAITLGDQGTDDENELGGRYGGLLSVEIPLFIDVYGEKASIALAIASDLKDRIRWANLPLVDQTNGQLVDGMLIEIDPVMGPEAPGFSDQAGALKRNWRVLRARTTTYFQD